MKNFDTYLKDTAEIGYVTKIAKCLLSASGLPGAHVGELVVFENGEMGQVLKIDKDEIEILTLSHTNIAGGAKVARTNEFLNIHCSESILGKNIDPLGQLLDGAESTTGGEDRLIDSAPPGVLERKMVTEPLETGVPLVDLVVPLAKGQRELVLGDKKTGKTSFLLRAIFTQANQGTICIYAAIAKKEIETAKIEEFLMKSGIRDKVIMVTTHAASPEGLIIITPYTAMTIAEYFKDQGKDVLLILDDMSSHAKFYREVSLLGRRFPGRNSYPGDIFHLHAKILERAGRFPKGSITCLAVGETVFGDLSGYMQTNLMSMTDGHIYFDSDYANLGRHPAINPFLSVTRIGHQAQSQLVRSIASELAKFLLHIEMLRDVMHFGAELSEKTIDELDLGERILAFFDLPEGLVLPQTLAIFCLTTVWLGLGKSKERGFVKEKTKEFFQKYQADAGFRKEVDELPVKYTDFKDLMRGVRPWMQNL